MISMNDFRAEPEALQQQQLAAAERVLRSGWCVLGNEIKTFEAAWAKRCGVSFAVGVGNQHDPHRLAQAEAYAAECLSIPCHPQMSDRDIAQVIEVINAYQ